MIVQYPSTLTSVAFSLWLTLLDSRSSALCICIGLDRRVRPGAGAETQRDALFANGVEAVGDGAAWDTRTCQRKP